MMIWKEKENFKEKTGIDTLFSHRRATPPGTDTPEVGSQQGREVREVRAITGNHWQSLAPGNQNIIYRETKNIHAPNLLSNAPNVEVDVTTEPDSEHGTGAGNGSCNSRNGQCN